MRERRVMYGVLVGKPVGKKLLGKPRRKRGIILRWIFRKYEACSKRDRAF
jgi:hypothetical protein